MEIRRPPELCKQVENGQTSVTKCRNRYLVLAVHNTVHTVDAVDLDRRVCKRHVTAGMRLGHDVVCAGS